MKHDDQEQHLLELFELTQHCGIPSSDLAEMVSLTQAGEPRVAFEYFCNMLSEYEVVLSNEIRTKAHTLATGMNLDERFARLIK